MSSAQDALALILAGHSPALELLGVSTVAGNQTVEKVTDNALRVLAAAGLPHVDVVAGAAKPLLRAAPILCAEIHGETGLDGPLGGPVLPRAPRAALPGKAPIVMFERIAAVHAHLAAAALAVGDGSTAEQRQQLQQQQQQQRQGARVQLVATAALTNVALLLALYPEVKDMIEVRRAGLVCPSARGLGGSPSRAVYRQRSEPRARQQHALVSCSGLASPAASGPSTPMPPRPPGHHHGRLPGGGQHGRRG